MLFVPTFESVIFLLTQALNFIVEPRLLVVAVDGNSLGGDAHRLAETDVGHYAVSKSVYIVLILSFENIPVSDVKTICLVNMSCNISIAPGELLLTHLVIGVDVLSLCLYLETRNMVSWSDSPIGALTRA